MDVTTTIAAPMGFAKSQTGTARKVNKRTTSHGLVKGDIVHVKGDDLQGCFEAHFLEDGPPGFVYVRSHEKLGIYLVRVERVRRKSKLIGQLTARKVAKRK